MSATTVGDRGTNSTPEAPVLAGCPLTWGLAIATYNRPEILLRTLDLAMRQTRLPIEIIVIDGSVDWAATRDRVYATLVPRVASIRWDYRQAVKLGASAQRNQAIALTTADVLFVLDDDTWMYPNAAERVMRIYEADPDQVIAGVMPLLTDVPPSDAAMAPAVSATDAVSPSPGLPNPPPDSGFNGLQRKLQRLNDLLKGPLLPPTLNAATDVKLPRLGTSANQVQALHGCRMTFRRAVAVTHPFDEHIAYLHDETEMCLRAHTSGAMVQFHEPLMFHAKSAGQLTNRRGADMRRRWLLNHAYMCRKLGGSSVARFVRQYNRRLTFADLALGLARRNLAYFHGCRQAKKGVRAILNAPDDQVAETYVKVVSITKN